MHLDANPRKSGSLALCLTRRGGVWVPVWQSASFRGCSWFPTPSPHKALFPAIKMFPELDTSGKFWKTPQEGDWAKRAPFFMPFRKCKMFALQDSSAQGPQLSRLENRGRQRSPLGNKASEEYLGSCTNHVPTRGLTCAEIISVKAHQKNRTHPR